MECVNWFFWQPPAPLVWIASVAAIIALVGWLVDTIIRIMTRPKLKVHFRGLNHTICCLIQNMPIGGGNLIRRSPVQDLAVRIGIIDMSIDDEMLNIVHWDKTERKISFGYDTAEKYRHITLPASEQGVDIEIARASELKSLAFNKDGELNIELHEGKYKAEITIQVNGNDIGISRDFEVKRSEPFIKWVSNEAINL
jgi:hypothetical protein